MTAKKPTKAAAKKNTASVGFSEEERAAMKEHAAELKAAARRGGSKANSEQDLLAKIADLDEPDRTMATRIHAIVRENAPELTAKTWYGMPAWARDGKVVCFFQPAAKFKSRYATLGFNDIAALDDGGMWPTAYALTELTADQEKLIAELVRKAVG
ncbi:DUF1801 domain-containing protein [Nocardia sp. CDC159]|uniref:DUF1801 domain-containing protein n=1 Tax=Nocardia pulmonis TaxID=2951408 RepID=A0A9X2E9D2_9NOCA|nr:MULTISPECIES: DUF1801 domain-containing protein [Nocardia]MCM6773923.1 DUF1801 domain-containing protein [Nocardia pulmonis]MCM6786810.1 DUF1801 domain-containing protein [Nocardia sp. CDC159]